MLNDSPGLAPDPVRHSPDDQATDTMDALDILMALSVRQYTDRLAETTEPMPAVRPIQRPVQRPPQRGPAGSHRKPRRQPHPVPRNYQRRAPRHVRGGFEHAREVVALIPAYREEGKIGATIAAMLAQIRVPDQIVVILNNCPDNTPAEARSAAKGHPEVTVIDTSPRRGKSVALNVAWNRYARDAWMVVGVDGDTILPPNAVSDWMAELDADPKLGGSSSKFTMPGDGILTRLQRAEFSRWTETSIRRGHTSVLAGTGCCFRGEALRAVAARDDREGPWSYDSVVEDFEATYRIRELGYYCHVSPTVPAYTDSMTTIRALWGQRMKWQTGTVRDLVNFGFTRLNARDWGQQILGLLNAMIRAAWLVLWVGGAATGWLHPSWTWWAFPAFFAVAEVIHSCRIPGRDWKDILMGACLLPAELFAWMRTGWFVVSWVKVLASPRDGDLWGRQYAAEAGRR